MEQKIYKIETYTDKSPKSIIKLQCESDGSFEYYGSAVVKFEDGNVPVQFPFPSDITKIQDCFEKFDENLDSYVKSISQNQQVSEVKENEQSSEQDNVIKFN
jgi:hypothetical protein